MYVDVAYLNQREIHKSLVGLSVKREKRIWRKWNRPFIRIWVFLPVKA